MTYEMIQDEEKHTLIIAVIIFIVAGLSFWPLVSVFILAFSLAVVLIPLKQRCLHNLKPGHAAILLTGGVFVTIIGGIFCTINVLYANLDYMKEITATIGDGFFDLVSDLQVHTSLPGTGEILNKETTQSILLTLLDAGKNLVLDFFASIPALLISGLIFFLALFLFVRNGEEIIQVIRELLPAKTSHTMDQISTVTVDTMYSVYIVNFQCAIVTFFCAIPFFMILGYGHVPFYAILAAIMQLIPFLGPQILIAILLIYALSTGDITGFLLLCFVGYPTISGWIDFYLRPKLMGDRVAIHPVLMMIGIFGGMMLLGLIGIILGPLIITLVVSAFNLMIQTFHDIKNRQNSII